MEGTPDSQSNRSQSDIFAELDDLAPCSSSCVSPDHPAGSQTDRSSPTTDLSPGLAALTVGCDSGDLGPLSRVQLLLLDRKRSESPGSIPSPEWCSTPDGEEYEPGLRVWSSGISQYYQSTVLDNRKPLSGRNSGQDSLATFKGRKKCPGLISVESGSRTSSSCSFSSRVSESSSKNQKKPTCEDQGCELQDEDVPLYLSPFSPSALRTAETEDVTEGHECAIIPDKNKGLNQTDPGGLFWKTPGTGEQIKGVNERDGEGEISRVRSRIVSP
ncbi:hypothetical protein DPX16_13022 [Anabarilius grahami]|uniref:Uncharacterized protein n=1 Tax=Anabarilius grahami TaxID=495550 RepID=A0A3N0XDR3_ANAGA|nr:hypothetical protein DPX16_13022 [Anabarilius grahami]